MKKEKEKININFFERLTMGRDKEYFLENLSMLIASGISIFDALNSIESDVNSKKMKKLIKQIRSDINEGYPLWRALDRSRIFPAHTISLIQIGEQSGKLKTNF